MRAFSAEKTWRLTSSSSRQIRAAREFAAELRRWVSGKQMRALVIAAFAILFCPHAMAGESCGYNLDGPIAQGLQAGVKLYAEVDIQEVPCENALVTMRIY